MFTTDQRRIAERQGLLGQAAERQITDLLMKAAGTAQTEARHIRAALHLAEQLTQQRLQLCAALSHACLTLGEKSRRQQCLQQLSGGIGQLQVNAALIVRILGFNDQLLGLQRLERLRHRALGQAQVVGHPQWRIGVVVAARQVHQRAQLDGLQLGQQRVLAERGVQDADIEQSRCQFCHSEPAHPEIAAAVTGQGYYIIPLQGC